MKIIVASGALVAFLAANSVLAGPDDSIASSYADSGVRQIDFRAGSIKQSNQDRASGATFGFGYGLTEQWFSELYVSYSHIAGDATQLDAVAWQNTFLLTHGQWPVDISLYTEIERPKDRSEGYEVTFGPLLQTEFGRTKVNANLLFQRDYRADFSNPMRLLYQWQIKHPWQPGLEFGMQGFGELGPWDHWAPRDEQSHRLGPAIFGKVALSEKQVINYNAAVLFDASDAQHSTTLRAQLVYGF